MEETHSATPDAWALEAAKLPLAFAQVREDPRLDVELAETLPAGAVVVMIASGGETLVQLARRIRESQMRLAAIGPLLSPAMRLQVKAGPIDEAGWTLLVSNNAVSAKLRQMVPALDAHLRTQGWDGPPVRVKLLNPG